MSTSSNLHWVDYAVIIGYFAVVIAVGIFSSIKVFVPAFTVKQVFTAWNLQKKSWVIHETDLPMPMFVLGLFR